MKIVNVMVDPATLSSPVERYVPRYMALRDKIRREVLAAARANPGVFVFPFATGRPEDAPDYRWLARRGQGWRDHIVRPIYVGNLRPVDQAISQIITLTLGSDAEEVGVFIKR